MVLQNVVSRCVYCRLLSPVDWTRVVKRGAVDRRNTKFSYDRDDFIICGKQYIKDDFNNLTTHLLQKIARSLLKITQNPISLVASATRDFFRDFKAFDYDDPVVSTKANFDDLLIPPDHISRSKTDTYYLNKDYLLRTHTSAHQTDCLSQNCGKFICIADVYRRDQIDRSHYPCFHQCEALNTFTPEELSLSSIYHEAPQARSSESQENYSNEATAIVRDRLKETIVNYVKFLLGGDIEYRWIDAYFPFTHPSWELEIMYKGDWLEVVGAGVVEEKILLNHGFKEKIGWALGFGLERLAMVRYNIPDIRIFWSTDDAFLRQFQDLTPFDRYTFKPLPKNPAQVRDISFWLPQSSQTWSPNDFYDLCRNVGGDSVEYVQQIDEFLHPTTKRTSLCYRITYRKSDAAIEQSLVQQLHTQIADKVESLFKVEVRR